MGRSSLNTLGVIVSTPHLAMNFPAGRKVVATVYVDQHTTREFYLASLKIEPMLRSKNKGSIDRRMMVAMTYINPKSEEERMEPKEEKVVCKLNDENHFTYIGSSVPREEMGVVVKILQKNKDLFA